jgi:hypothetical protein
MNLPAGKWNEISHLHYPMCLRAGISNAISRKHFPTHLPEEISNETFLLPRSNFLRAEKLCVNWFLRYP